MKVKNSTSKLAKWDTLKDGTRVLRLWETIGPEWPQLALLELTNEQYKKLIENPTEYINQRSIFPKDVNPGASCVGMVPPSRDFTGLWYVAVAHKYPSGAAAAAYPAEP